MSVNPMSSAAWLCSRENTSYKIKRYIGWKGTWTGVSVKRMKPPPNSSPPSHPTLSPKIDPLFLTNGITFILLSISSSHFFKKMLDEFTPLHFLSPKPDKWEHFLSAKLVNCWAIPAILAAISRHQRAVFLFSHKQAWPGQAGPGQTGDNNFERSGYAILALAAHHQPAPATTGFVYATTPSLRPDIRKGGGHKVYPGNIVYTIGLQHIRFCQCNSTMIQKLRKGGEKEAQRRKICRGAKIRICRSYVA